MQHQNIHIIQRGETLQNLAEKYGISAEMIKYFHNNNCVAKDTILIDISHQKELFLPRYVVDDKAKLVHFLSGNQLVFNPQNWNQNFGITIRIENGDVLNILKYETFVRWLKTENRLHYFEIDRTSKFFINEEEANDIADLLAYKTSQVLYPLYIAVDTTGKFSRVENLDIYKERWEGVKEEVYKEFEGEVVNKYCSKIENIINEPETLSLYLKNDYFLRTLFWGIYRSFGDDYKIKGLETFPIIDNPIEPQYKIEVEIDPLKDDNNLIHIEGNGILHEKRSVQDFINNALFAFSIEEETEINTEGNVKLQFYMNAETSLPEFLYLECDIQLQEPKKVSVVLTILEESNSQIKQNV